MSVDLAVILADGEYLKRSGDSLVGDITAGPTGPPGADGAAGPAGPQGDPGEPGGALLSAFWTYNTPLVPPPIAGAMRTNSPITEVYVNEQDTDGYNRTVGLGTVTSTSKILVRAANGTAMDLQITGTPVDNGTYWTFPVSVISGTVTKGARTQLNFITPSVVGIPTGGTTGEALTKTSATDYAVGWSMVAPVRRTLNAQTGTTYTPVVTDENLMVTLSNAAAITVTLPQNSTQAFPVGAEVDFVWLGVGQPTFAAGSGATVNGTPGLKLRAQYSAATAKKVSTNGWIMIGDLAA